MLNKHFLLGSLLTGTLLFLPNASAPVLADSKVDKATCTFQGKKLFGRVQIVEHFGDIKVKVVNVFPDLKVQKVTVFPDNCGQWQMVDVFPDLKIQIVDVFPDIEVKYVNVFPGVP